MNEWLWTAFALILCLVPCLVVCLRGEITDRIVGLETGGVLCVLILLLLAEGYQRESFSDLALTLALLEFGGGLVFVRFLERWM
ncbi:MAG TPA: monovalent cation/H+ antiporter complex subunit F [Bryobacteraceae bacterium]|jgi:multisubunit Na+/H+ antiporter MnhF subunit